jgi:hypothetical protein
MKKPSIGSSGPWLLCLALAFLATHPSFADEADRERPGPLGKGWIPSLALGIGVQHQDLDGETRASFADFSQGGSANDILTGDFRGRIELASPALYEDGMAPRFFVHSGFSVPFSDEFVSERLNLSFGGNDPGFPTSCAVTPPDSRILSCDTRTRSTVTVNAYWHAGVGIDLTLPFDRRQFRLRPSLDYVGQAVEIEGRAERILRGASNVELPGGSRIGASSDEELIHGLGPRIQLDVEVAEIRELTISLFVEAGFFWMLSDRELRASKTDAAGDSVRFDVELDAFAPQGGAGIRVAWTGAR